MGTAICKCGMMTNSTTSNMWFTKDQKPTKCWARHDGKKWIEGCSYKEADKFEKSFADGLIKNEVKP